MRDAETILAIIRDRGTRGLPLEDVYRQLFNPALYQVAYGRLARNRGAMTPGVTPETVDGMSQEHIQAIIDAIRLERYRWKPAKRVFIEKKGSIKKRALGLPTWSDKVLQEVIRLILEAYYEPQFSDHSHGFRPGRGCHTALGTIYHKWSGTIWFLEGDISSYYDSIDHEVLLAILREKIHDGRFLRLIENLLKAGYLEDWRFNPTLSGAPQGGVVSPILSNIYLDRLDKFVENTLLPAYNWGAERKTNKAYNRITAALSKARRKGDRERAKALHKLATSTPTRIPGDRGFRRLKYVRYADDFLLGYIGPRSEAEQVKHKIGQFLRETLKLELSESKTLLTHATTGSARFLGYDLTIARDDRRRNARGQRSINGQPTLRVPIEVIQAKCRPYMARGKPVHRPERLHDDPFSIVAQYQAEYRGVVNYYRMAVNLHSLSRLRWIMEQSLTKTLAHKLRLSVQKVYRRFETTINTTEGRHKVLRVVVARAGKPPLDATWGGISLKRDKLARLDDAPPRSWNGFRSELLQRLLADTCELCGSHDRVQVHHVRALRKLHRPGRVAPPQWVQQMASRQRKTLVVCHDCHRHVIHRDGGRLYVRRSTREVSGEPGARKPASPVRRGAVGKVLDSV
jgi:group II intron reverse transcriptase/maturase